MPWSVNAGFLSRVTTRAGRWLERADRRPDHAWKRPDQDLLEKPSRAKVYPNNFRPVCYAPGEKLTERTTAFRRPPEERQDRYGRHRYCGGSRSATTRRG